MTDKPEDLLTPRNILLTLLGRPLVDNPSVSDLEMRVEARAARIDELKRKDFSRGLEVLGYHSTWEHERFVWDIRHLERENEADRAEIARREKPRKTLQSTEGQEQRKNNYRTEQWKKAIPIIADLREGHENLSLKDVKKDDRFLACFPNGLPSDDRIRHVANGNHITFGKKKTQ